MSKLYYVNFIVSLLIFNIFADLSTGLIAYYPFNGDAKDYSGNGNDAFVSGAMYTTDRFGQAKGALQFDGINDYVLSPTEPPFDLTEFTIIVTLKVNNYTKNNYILSKGASYGNYCLKINSDTQPWSRKIAYVHRTSTGNYSQILSKTSVPNNEFFQVAVTVKGSKVSGYINGSLKSRYNSAKTPVLNNSRFIIGAAKIGTYQYFKGVIDEVHVYNRLLSNNEIYTLYNNQHAQPKNTILGHKKGGTGIWTVQSNGAGWKILTKFGCHGEFSRGGDKIVFEEYNRSGIWSMNADGSNQKRIANEGGRPSWSPNGEMILYVIGKESASDRQLWIMKADGTDARMLTNRAADNPNWSHFGDKIVFESPGDGIWTINVDGTDETQLLTYGQSPSWSYDDGKIIFSNGQIYKMNADGSGIVQVSTRIGYTSSMGSNGDIVFESNDNNLYIISGATETKLTSGIYGPDWCLGDANPPYALGPVFSGVGLVPSTQIFDGYATTDPSYFIHVDNAAFGRTLHIFGNFSAARSNSISRYKVLYAKWTNSSTPPNSSAYSDLVETWGNYLWDPSAGKYKYKIVRPDDENSYEVPPAHEMWYLDNLLIKWRSFRFDDGKYSLKLIGFDAAGDTVPINGAVNNLTLMIDNTAPVAKINAIVDGTDTVDACDIIHLTTDTPLDFVITAYDDEGHLRSFSLNAHYGHNDNFNIISESYDPSMGIFWNGYNPLQIIHSSWPQSCAYNFRLNVRGRVINGYHWVQYRKDNYNVTLILP